MTKFIGVCRCFFREIEAVTGGESSFSGFLPVDPLCLHPSANPQIAAAGKGSGDYHPCGGLAGVARSMPGPDHCVAMFIPADLVNMLQEEGNFLISAGWLEQWRHFMKSWGFTPEIALQFFGEAARRILVIDTGLRDGTEAELALFSAFIGLPAKRLKVGMAFFRDQWKTTGPANGSPENVTILSTESGFAMALDLISQIASLGDIDGCIDKVFETFAMLFAPEKLTLTPSVEGLPRASWSFSTGREDNVANPDPGAAGQSMPPGAGHFSTSPGHAVPGFEESGDPSPVFAGATMWVPLVHNGASLGALRLDGIEHPEYAARYSEIARAAAGVSSLALRNSLTFDKLGAAYAELRDAQEKIRVLRGILPICAGCKKIRDDQGYWKDLEDYISKNSEAVMSHGICPDCTEKLYPDLAKDMHTLRARRLKE